MAKVDLATPRRAQELAARHREAWSDPVKMECTGGCGATALRCYRRGAVVNGRRPTWHCGGCGAARR